MSWRKYHRNRLSTSVCVCVSVCVFDVIVFNTFFFALFPKTLDTQAPLSVITSHESSSSRTALRAHTSAVGVCLRITRSWDFSYLLCAYTDFSFFHFFFFLSIKTYRSAFVESEQHARNVRLYFRSPKWYDAVVCFTWLSNEVISYFFYFSSYRLIILKNISYRYISSTFPQFSDVQPQ